MSRPAITLTTDFGLSDGYVAAMKGVILSLCPQATCVDIAHDVAPQAIRQAAYLLSSAAPYFPPGTVHLAVVDPGVGTERRAIAVQTSRALYVAPDNGLLSLALARDPALMAVHLTDPRYRLSKVSATFHGRDIFAPAAAHLACGTHLRDMGQTIPIDSLAACPGAPDGKAEVLHVDRFGNLITDYQARPGQARLAVVVGGTRVERMGRTFADAAPGELLVYAGSSGTLEIAIRGGSAARELGVGVGSPVEIEEIGRDDENNAAQE